MLELRTPISDMLVKEIEKILTQYNDGAICSPEVCTCIANKIMEHAEEVNIEFRWVFSQYEDGSFIISEDTK